MYVTHLKNMSINHILPIRIEHSRLHTHMLYYINRHKYLVTSESYKTN